MDAFSWQVLARNAMWIVGLGVAFAAVSHAIWRASESGEPLRRELVEPAFLIPGSTGLLLVTTSLAFGAISMWERGLWIAVSIALSWHIFALVRQERWGSLAGRFEDGGVGLRGEGSANGPANPPDGAD